MELLVRIVDKTNDDPVLDPQLFKRGDVIHIAEDGHVWGHREVDNPHWVIIKVPNLSKAAEDSLLSPDVVPDLQKQYVIRKRAIKLDLDSLGIATEKPKDVPSVDNLSLVNAIEVKEPPKERQVVIGPDDPIVIG